MQTKIGWAVGLVLGLASLGCSDGDAPPAECTLPETPRFDFTKVDLDDAKSNAECPQIAPTDLDTDALTEQGLCERAIVDCEIELNCDYEGLDIRGRMAESDGQLIGRFSIETPITCLYSVEAKWKEPTADGG